MRLRRDGEDGSAFAFGIRLLATVALTFALTGITGYVLLERSMAHQLIDDYAEGQRADARAFELEGGRATSTADGIGDVQRLLEGVEQRPGTLAVSLIDQQHVIRAAGDRLLVGRTEADARIDAALEHGSSYAGREGGRGKDASDFEFIVPVDLPGGRYAYEVTYDHHTYDAQLSELRKVLALIGLFTLIGGGAAFYLLGGRRLMRDHRMVLQRATRDGLTDLPNQRAFQDELPQAVASAARYEDHFALALLDVDDFKLINDRHGHPHGDAILQSVAQVLREARPGDRPYRIGGDEFALALTHTDAEGARAVARRLSRSLKDAGINASVGVSALRPGQQADTLRAEADAALYEAKREGGNRATHFDDIREHVAVITSEKKEAVVRLIDEGRIDTLFQPIWNLDAQSLLGVEALTRPDPSYGLSGPAEAFDVAEQIGRVHQLDVLCVENALRLAPQLHPGVLLFLNLSPLTLDLDAEADAWLAPAVERAGLTPQAVVVEVTERSGGRTERVVKRLQRLRAQGFKLAVDDVGTGNSGLEMLSKIDAEFVKLDRSIITAAATEPGARAVLMAMATFARQTGAFVIAEGIEDEDTLQFLCAINDEHALASDAIIQGGQGFGLGRPSHELSSESPAMLHDGHGHAHPAIGG
ncbi:MAG TPA: bifunctional diguanylate cyclase/phosphodiesterase [Solirubrobacteraceae bacterium]|jgi:diguanylate cyclase (GGDEF)-like protein|nr:bifunctional diguanylate cyclase/phosphodiesterase [Solirubrobacteraceae bacterium]